MSTYYGKEVILDIYDCDPSTYDTREKIEQFCVELCDLIKMEREDLHFWDYEGMPGEYEAAPPHLKGRSAVQFIKTSNVTIHTLDDLRRVYLNVFSCKNFCDMTVRNFCEHHFKGTILNHKVVKRV